MKEIRLGEKRIRINSAETVSENYLMVTIPLAQKEELEEAAKILEEWHSGTAEILENEEILERYDGMTVDTPLFCGVEPWETASFYLRHKTDEERQQETMAALAVILTDEQAVGIPDIYPAWEDDPEGYHYSLDNPKDRRRLHADGLWKLLQDHDKQASWYPGAAPTLWVQLDADQHAGTQEDPIPVPVSVTTSGFEYEAGKYYTWAGQTYLCQRDGMESGAKITLYYPPSDLVGHYFVAV